MKSSIAYKNEIRGFEDVSATVKLVEKIAASSVHRLKKEVANLNIHTTAIEAALSRLSLFYEANDHPLLQKRTGKNALVILTAEKGLVGGLWHKIVNSYLENIKHYNFVIIIGAKGESYLKEENAPILKFFTGSAAIPLDEEIRPIVNYIFSEFTKGTFAQVDVLYPQFISLAEQQPTYVSFLPFNFKIKKYDYIRKNGLPIFEPSQKKIFNRFLENYISIFFNNIVMEAKLSELSSRMVAMERASSKTDELVKKIAFDYTKQRHLRTTQKQIESFAVHKIL